MKPFTEYFMELNHKYDFTVRLAGCDMSSDMKSRMESALAMYVVESIGSFRRLPIQEHAEFPGMGPCEVHVVEVSLKYPTITDQLRRTLAEKLQMPAKSILVRTRLEEAHREPQPVAPKAKDGSLLNNPELAAESAQDLVGHARVSGMLKSLVSRKYEFAAKEETATAMPDATGTTSPVGSHQNTIPSPVRGK